MKKRASIAGGGIAGLSLGLMLARIGWSVRVHEQADAIREVGAGIFLRNNSIEVLEEFGVLDSLRAKGAELTTQLTVDRSGKVMETRALVGQGRVTVLERQALVDELRNAAISSGVEIVTSSRAVDIDPAGRLTLESGEVESADLVVAADGVWSKLRPRLGLPTLPRKLPTTINRFLLPHRKFTTEPFHYEHWGVNRRIGIAPSGPNSTYIYQVCRVQDTAAGTLPTEVSVWSEAIPGLKDLFEEMAVSPGIPHQYLVVRCEHWSQGRAAIIGDAAHGLPPTLGQGAGLSIMNARGLTAALALEEDVPTALRNWETMTRHITDRTQGWAVRFDVFANRFPDSLAFMRWPVAWSFKNIPALNKRMRIAERGLVETPLGKPLSLVG